jgi:hypothetical protein
VNEMRGFKNLQQRTRHLRAKVKAWNDRFVLDTGDGGGANDSGSWLHDCGEGPTRKVEIGKLSTEADGLATAGATGFNTAGFRSLALELKAQGKPLSDTGVA